MGNYISELKDLEAILSQARRKWEREQRAKRGVQEQIGNSVPWWLVAIAAVMFLLSVPHTASMFALITPVLGLLAPIGVEFGLLYVAFYRYSTIQQQAKVSWTLHLFEILLVIICIIVNGTGSLVAVANGVGLNDKSFESIKSQFGTLPITSQVALLLVPFAALIIPAGTWVAGEGLAQLFLERKRGHEDLDKEWIGIAARVEYNAVYLALIQRGVTPMAAANEAARFIVGRHGQSADKKTSADSGRTENPSPQTEQPPDPEGGIEFLELADPVGYAYQKLLENPALAELSVRDLSKTIRVRRASAHKALQMFHVSEGSERVQ